MGVRTALLKVVRELGKERFPFNAPGLDRMTKVTKFGGEKKRCIKEARGKAVLGQKPAEGAITRPSTSLSTYVVQPLVNCSYSGPQ